MVAIYDDEDSMEQDEGQRCSTVYAPDLTKKQKVGQPKQRVRTTKRPTYAIMAEIAIIRPEDKTYIENILQFQVDRMRTTFLNENVAGGHTNAVEILQSTCTSCATLIAKAIQEIFDKQTFYPNADAIRANAEWKSIQLFMSRLLTRCKKNMTSLCKGQDTHEKLAQELEACMRAFYTQAKVSYAGFLEKGVKPTKSKNETLHLQRELAEEKRAHFALKQAIAANMDTVVANLYAVNENL